MKTRLSNAINTDTIENMKHVAINVLDTQFFHFCLLMHACTKYHISM